MKNWVFYIITFLYISASTPLSEIYKLPVFVTHFAEHYHGGNVASEMKEFLVHHYGGHEKDADWETDQKLPFIKVEMAHFDIMTLPPYKIQIPKPQLERHYEPILVFNEDVFYSYYLNSIWRPPKHS